MNTKAKSRHPRPLAARAAAGALRLALVLMLLVGGVNFAHASYVEDTYRYSVTLSGANTITIKAPIYDEDGADNWVDNGYLKVQVADKDGNFGSEKTVIWWTKDENSHDNDDKDLWTKFWTAMDGSFDITQGNSGSHFTLTKGDGTLRRLVYENSDGNTYDFTAVWRVPYDLLGKTLKFSWDVKCDYTNGLAWDTHYSVSPSGCEITLPKAQATVAPQVTMATMSYSEVGKLEMPWFMGATTLTAVRYEYVDAYGITVWKEMPTNENNGTIYLDATVPHDNFAVVVSYKDNNGYDVTNISSGSENLQMIHAPVGLTATPTGNHKAAVRLDWHIRHTGTNDITSTDFFEVQRSLTGQEADFVTIGSVPFTIDPKNPYFTFTDSTLVAAVTAEQLTAGSSLPNLTYRVRRMITQTWGWDGNPCAQRVEAPLSGMHLRRLKSYSARWEDERAYTVRVTWDYVDEPNAVWDNRAKLMMVVTMKNSAGQPTDTLRYELTADERDSRTKVLDFSRPCLKYDVRMFVDPGTSPLRSWDLPDAMRIASAADWDAFCQRVKDAKGQRDVNAVLCADITTGTICADDNFYRGTFDGNGHTLTFNKQNYNQQYVAPFYHVGDATIRNLHTAGTITSSQKFVGGIVAYSNGNTIIENCRSSVSIGSTVSGDTTNGGLVAVKDTQGQLTIVDCLFDGSLTGNNSNCIGGFVGWSAGKVNIVNSHFAPSKVEIKYDGCRNWARMSDNSNLTVTNSHYATSIETSTDDLFVIRSKDDWTAFRTAVENAKGQKDVNAVLETDLTLTESDIVADLSYYCYRGTFDGHGHTLNLNFDGNSTNELAVFKYVTGSATFRNLRVTGTVIGRSDYGYNSALVGICEQSCSNLNIDHVHSSANVSGGYYVTGLVGTLWDRSKANITDCLYDGKFTNYYRLSCFIGGGVDSPKLWTQARLYERSTSEYNVGSNFYAMNFWYGKIGTIYSNWPWSDTDVCLSSHDFKELPEDCRNITDQDTVLARMNASMPGQWEKDGSGNAVPIVGMTGARLLTALGPCWQLSGGKVTPRTATVSVNPSALPDFYHEGTGRISKTLLAETRQSSVVLTWDLEDGVVDYFQVLRRLKGSSDDWEVVAPQVDKMGYEDKTVSPLENYEYKVVAVADCEGTHTSETNVVAGSCKHTGRVSGYVRMNDGTGVAGIEVEIAREGHDGDKTTVTTDESGYFMADELSYYGGRSITYIVSPVSRDKIVLEVESRSVTFDNESNDEQLPEFTITSGHRFSGYVMYEGTSIPVKGAHFRVDGRELHDASGRLVETDYDGSFSFRVLGGTRRIQAVMDGHDFTGEGYYKGPEGHNFTDDVAQIYFYDKTKVLLAGRVAGGDDQGRLPLQNNLSRNNLGDGLTMVFTLEGDNTSWLVYDNLNPGLSQRIDTVWHKGGNHHTVVTTQRKRMEVKPDSITGEYELKLPPVRWKVQQIYCKGYATLFQEGQVSQVVDLTDCLNATDSIHEGTFMDVDQQSIYRPRETCKARFSRIYHAPVEITYRQIGYDTFSYFGDKTYTATTVGGTKTEVPLAYEGKDGVHYTFGHPVFSVGRKYPIEISVGERYIYNNDTRLGRVDRVSVGGGTVTVHNGMRNGLDQETVELNDEGQGIYYLLAEATPRLLTGEDALHTVTMTLTQDGTTYEAAPLRGYTLNMFSTGTAKDVVVSGMPLLVDILRDPPGGGSSATLSKGSTLKYSYTLDMSLTAGLHLEITTGEAVDYYQGIVAAPEGAGETGGLLNKAANKTWGGFEYAFDMEGHKGWTYTMNLDQDISTSTAPGMVGADADLFIGITQNIVTSTYSTIRAIPDGLYRQMLGRTGSGDTQFAANNSAFGTLVHIAEGRDEKDSLYHLVRDESIGYGPEVKSQFVHSQKYIVTELIPQKVKELRSLMFTGTATEAQTLANATGKPVYRSLRSADDERFAVMNTKDGKHVYNLSTAPQGEDMNYVIHLPAGTTGTPDDEVYSISQIIYAWVQMLASNEHDKLAATEHVGNYDVDGGSALSYSETFESEFDVSHYYHLPGIVGADYFFTGSDAIMGGISTGVTNAGELAMKAIFENLNKEAQATVEENGDEVDIEFEGKNFQFLLYPIFNYTTKDVSGESKAYSRKESFNISMDKLSHLNFDVYRAMPDTAEIKDGKVFDVFTSHNFVELTKIVEKNLRRGVDITPDNMRYARGFVYRTRGGATANPWENARYTHFYKDGILLDERTKKIENPKITVDRQSVSGVPYGEPARFTLYLTNDSEDPEAAARTITEFSFYLDDSSNPYGARITIDGRPINGRTIILAPGQVVTKELEVSGGNSFDLEGLTIGIASDQDWRQIYDEVSLDVHYLHQAGPVRIATPGDKWVMNTYAEHDDRGWFLPVTIDGFDKHQHNFDHIEFQYKESLRGDDSWTNLCSYYADAKLMEAASGTRMMIPENGNIETHFYGEGTVMEKAYDLRAVLYCRNGNEFLTTASPVISGVKDTRRPQIFGTPEPKTGIVKAGDDIVFNFSEDIEYNYLNAITNFEVKGEVNNDNVTDAVSVQFTGEGSVESEAQRNFSGKDLTIDLMVRPDKTGRDMPLFSHGTNGKKLQLWLTADYHLKAIIDDQTFVSTDTIVKSGFTQVAMSIVAPSGAEGGALTFYNGGKQLGSFKMTEPYNGTGRLIFGRTNETNRSKSQYYEGRMMEARVWYRAMTGGQVGTTYGSRRLTGYEMGLVDYYPMNEGTGDYALDKTQGANAQLMGASWAMPRGWSLSLDNGGVALTQQALARTAEQDYTMMFWFKTADADGTLVSNGSGEKDEAGAENHFWLGFDDGTLAFRSNGMTVEAGSGYNDDQWHHYAMTVNRARGVVNIYIDQALKATFSPDSLGGISGGTPVIGGYVPGVTDNTAIATARTQFAEPTAETGNTVDLSTLTSNYEAKDGDVLTGTLGKDVKISIASGATVTLKDATINGHNNKSFKWAGISCSGDASIVLEGTNTVKGFHENYPGIYIVESKTLTIKGDGSLTASSNGYAPGIGGGRKLPSGNIVIESGTITATGGEEAVGIGSGYYALGGNITIKGGNITAIGGQYGAGIGAGNSDIAITCGDITITGGIINATGGEFGAGIGSGCGGSCGDITISGGTIIATGGVQAAGIGSGQNCDNGNITITDGVYQLTATKGIYALHSIGVGMNGGFGTITIGGQVYKSGIDESPFIYTPVRGVSLNKTSTTLTVGSSETLTATVIPDNATDKSVTWMTSNAAVATVTDGTVTAVAPGTATITVTTGNGAKTATCTVTVIQLTTGVSLNKVNTTLVVGSTETLTATVYPPNATDKSVTWTTSNADVATVADGTVTGVGPGIATITATSSNGQTATCEVTVIQHVTGVSLNKTSMTMTMGSTETLTATVSPANASDKSVAWTTSNANVAMVADGVVTAVAPGTATITVTTNDGAKTATCTVTVTIEGLISDMTGNVDELCMFQQALPLTLIKAYATKSPQGDEAGLLTYLAFDRQERQKDNDIETVAYTWSKKIYLDDRGEVRYELDPVTKQATTTPVRDYVFVGSADEILRHITNETAAPVVPYEELTNLKFSFAGKDNQVLVELDELASRINRRNIYVTLRDVEDKNGNAMVSPQTACYYVTNSSLRWLNERQTCLASYGYEDYIYFDILNNSATSHTYTIENCPRWLDMEAYTGIIGPLGTVTIRGVVNKSLNVGTYDEIIYLTDEDGVAEPLYLNLTVTTSAPEWSWSVDEDLLKYSMNIAGQVILNGEVDIDSRDIVGVFDRENRCHGIAHVNYSALTGESDLFLTVYDSSKSGKELFFKLWQYSTGRELVLTADGKESMTFQSDARYGIDTPVRLEGGELYVQTFDLKEGWNWVSFNVASEKLFNLNNLLDGLPWQNGDVLTEMSGSTTLTYTNGTWLATGGVKSLRISPRKGYAIKVAQDTEFPVGGNIIKSEDARTIIVNNGWNGIGYTPMLNLSVETALSDYYDQATPGDIIKSHDEFAYFTKTGGTGRWRGSLEYMKPGQGYMLLRKAEGEASFRYPFYEPGSTFLDALAVAGSRRAPASLEASPADREQRWRHTMSVCAVIEGFEPEEGDRLVAYADGEPCGATAATVPGGSAAGSTGSTAPADPLYLTIGGEKPAAIWFAIERDGDIVATTGNVLTFHANDVVGTPDEPYAISFAAATAISTVGGDDEEGKWYTVNGIELPQRPKRKGVYIYNGNKIVIK